MKTKICKGPLHPEGIELPIEDFYSTKMKHVCLSGEVRIYHSYFPSCKACERIKSKKYKTQNPEVVIRGILKYLKTDKGKAKKAREHIKWRNTHRQHNNKLNRRQNRIDVDTLSYGYVHKQWNKRFKRRGLIPPEFTNDIWLAESIKIQTIRKNKQLKLTA